MRETNDKTQMLCSHSTTDLSPHLAVSSKAKPDKNKLTSIVERMSHINISNYSNITKDKKQKTLVLLNKFVFCF